MQNDKGKRAKDQEAVTPVSTTPDQDLATILSKLPGGGAEDDVTRVMDLYEAAERSYRASMKSRSLKVGSSASTNG